MFDEQPDDQPILTVSGRVTADQSALPQYERTIRDGNRQPPAGGLDPQPQELALDVALQVATGRRARAPSPLVCSVFPSASIAMAVRNMSLGARRKVRIGPGLDSILTNRASPSNGTGSPPGR